MHLLTMLDYYWRSLGNCNVSYGSRSIKLKFQDMGSNMITISQVQMCGGVRQERSAMETLTFKRLLCH
jgi:ribulose kinase